MLRLPGGRTLLVQRRTQRANLLLALLLAAAAVMALSLGSTVVAPHDAVTALFGGGDAVTRFLIQALRGPRLLAGILTGTAFAVAGCLMQTLAHNRLATPGIIGIDNGATAFAVASVLGVGIAVAPPAMALVGAATATALAFGLAGGTGTRGYRFIVAGIAIGALFGAVTQLMLARVAIDAANQAYPWTVGTLNARSADAVWVLGAGVAVGLPAALALARTLTVMRLSDFTAQGLGVRVRACRWLSLAVAVLLTALAVAVAGPVGLVGLVGPEIARHLSAPASVPVVGAALAGALVMVLADLAGRLLLAPIEIPVGIVTAVVGGPYLLWILLRASRMTP
ncbi:iron ABC transporter permease [Arhodomonas aquaeolei]|uniref:FecCD family ABC transporter permease n=1 Tax=Arhodomonas TaxID=2368 RepID=UPI00037F86DD|nr:MULTISPECIES: iron ABC transporter permease [Arhodomonas]MCS4505411.1 iron ABC transporter permease [Arhodomonas aquaeolei]